MLSRKISLCIPLEMSSLLGCEVRESVSRLLATVTSSCDKPAAVEHEIRDQQIAQNLLHLPQHKHRLARSHDQKIQQFPRPIPHPKNRLTNFE